MKPAHFDYLEASSISDAVEMLAASEEAKVLAGGQSLMPMLATRLARPTSVVDIGRIDDLRTMSFEGATLRLGSMVTQRRVETDVTVNERLPLLTEAVRLVGHEAIRNRGTVGGSLAHADPAAELPAVATALDATLVADGPNGRRQIPVDEFFVSFLTTSLDEGEILTAVDIPIPSGATGSAFVEFARKQGDFAIVSVAALVEQDDDGAIRQARVAIGGAGPTPVRATACEAHLRDKGRTGVEGAASIAGDEVEPVPDIHGTADYRRHLTRALVGRALTTAIDRAGNRRESP